MRFDAISIPKMVSKKFHWHPDNTTQALSCLAKDLSHKHSHEMPAKDQIREQEEDDEPDEWYTQYGTAAGTKINRFVRDKRIFSTGCAGRVS